MSDQFNWQVQRRMTFSGTLTSRYPAESRGAASGTLQVMTDDPVKLRAVISELRDFADALERQLENAGFEK